MAKPKSTKGRTPKKKLTKKNNSPVDEEKKQTKISAYFSKVSLPQNNFNSKPSLAPNLKRFSKSKAFSSVSQGLSSENKNDTKNTMKLSDSPCKNSSDDSDIEIIESTPECVKSNGITLLKLGISCQDSPDIIPPTPQLSSSRLHQDSKLNSIFNGSIKNKISNISFKSKLNIKSNTRNGSVASIKRGAETSCGISPDAKRINENPHIVKNISCKLNLLSKMVTAVDSDTSKNENESSFSILQPVFKTLKETTLPNEIDEIEIENTVSQNIRTEGIENIALQSKSNFMLGNEDAISSPKENPDLVNISVDTCSSSSKHTNDSQSKENIQPPQEDEFLIQNVISQNTSFKENHDTVLQSKSNFKMQNDYTVPHISENIVGSTPDSHCNLNAGISSNCNNINSELSLQSDDSLDKLLTENFIKLSPFKCDNNQSKTEVKYKTSIEKLLSEGLGSLSYAVKGNFGRFIVVDVQRNIYNREILLHLKSPVNQCSKKCSLSGFWYESSVKEGDIVHILNTDEVNGQFYVSNEQGIVVINPDYLISGTSVVSAVFCPRKSVLNERFKGYDSGNKIMIIGSLVHQLFQEIVTKKITKEADIMSLITNIVSHHRVLKEFYGRKLSVEEVLEDMNKFVPLIKSWNENYLKSELNSAKQIPEGNWSGKIVAVKDIEENFWSPRFGLKGKIDLTVEAESGKTSKILPLELKTGRPSFSAEHKGQVTLYSMIMSDRRKDPQSGLLLYLKDGSMVEVPAGEKEKRALIQLRNDVVRYLAERISEVDIKDLNLPSLPPPLNNQRMCSRCEHQLTCTTLLKVKGEDIPENHSMNYLVPMATGHLSENHFEYFRKWCIMLHLEISATDNESSIRSLWCQDSTKREALGNCLSNITLVEDPEDFGNGYFMHTFRRNDASSNITEQLPKCFQVGENILVSSESEIALSLGVVYNIEEKDSVTLILDKNLTIYPNIRKKNLCIDRCEYQNNMTIFFTNILELLQDTDRSMRLRQLLIDREEPDFQEGLDRKLVTEIKSILKIMNKEQQRAILRSLLAKDYSIIKGYPGTGKTSTIIGLVRLLNATGHSVLLTSYTHSAVDNILLKLKDYEDVEFLRLGKVSRIHKDILQYSDEILTKNMKSLSDIEEFYDKAKIVATTCLGMGHVLFRRKIFDFCIIDEASQALEAASLGPLFFCSRFILVGDSLQLPPVIKSQTAKELGMMKSLFERLDNEKATVCLSLQYRMNEPIMNIANQLIYEGQLKCGTDELRCSTLSDLKSLKSIECTSWLSRLISCELKDSVLLVDTLNGAPEERDCSGQVINTKEAKVIFAILPCFLKMGINPHEIGIITPYRAQVKYLKETLLLDSSESLSCIEINTVDQYQGRDKSVILYSCVRSGLRQEDIKKGEILNDIRRLNVAVTRAKTKLIIIGSLETLLLFEPFKKLIKSLEKNQIYELRENVEEFSWKSL